MINKLIYSLVLLLSFSGCVNLQKLPCPLESACKISTVYTTVRSSNDSIFKSPLRGVVKYIYYDGLLNTYTVSIKYKKSRRTIVIDISDLDSVLINVKDMVNKSKPIGIANKNDGFYEVLVSVSTWVGKGRPNDTYAKPLEKIFNCIECSE